MVEIWAKRWFFDCKTSFKILIFIRKTKQNKKMNIYSKVEISFFSLYPLNHNFYENIPLKKKWVGNPNWTMDSQMILGKNMMLFVVIFSVIKYSFRQNLVRLSIFWEFEISYAEFFFSIGSPYNLISLKTCYILIILITFELPSIDLSFIFAIMRQSPCFQMLLIESTVNGRFSVDSIFFLFRQLVSLSLSLN